VYIEKHRAFGYEDAKKWYYEFIPVEIQQGVTDAVHKIVAEGVMKK
jgi:hypothetical protein